MCTKSLRVLAALTVLVSSVSVSASNKSSWDKKKVGTYFFGGAAVVGALYYGYQLYAKKAAKRNITQKDAKPSEVTPAAPSPEKAATNN